MRPTRRQFLATSATAALAATACHGQAPVPPSPSGKFPHLRGFGERFTFAIIADPQLGHANSDNRVFANARRTLMQCVADIDAMEPQPAFVLFLGDLVNHWDTNSVANFEECIAPLKAQRVITHGNHDTQPPYTEFRALVQRHCGFDDVFYSFDAGAWHFVALPCNLEGKTDDQRAVEAAMLAWLEQDLEANKARPTIILEHLHTLPIGTAQTEWYAFPLRLRKALMELYTRHGNVRWYFNGHVHNGLKVTSKTSWRYKGINVVNCPTIIETRPFGEEFAGFEKGLDEAGFYLLADVDGDRLRLRGRRAGQREEHVYDGAFREFTDAVEPRWWTPINAFPPSAQLLAPRFENAAAGWLSCYRYQTDEDTGYLARSGAVGELRTLYVQTKAKPSAFWANDEHTELYQVVRAPEAPVLRARYRLDTAPESGGGYVRVAALSGTALRLLMMWYWGHDEAKADYLPRCIGYGLLGEQQGWNFLQKLAAEKRGFFWRMPDATGVWHEINADLARTCGDALGAPGAYAGLGVDKLVVAFGTWCNRELGSVSGAHFAEVRLDAQPLPYDAAAPPIGPEIYDVPFAQALNERQPRQQDRKQKA